MRIHSRMMLAALAASLALLLIGATAAQAKVTPLTGTTTLTPSPQATEFLANHGVAVAPTGAATAENGSFVFPIVAGFGTRSYSGLLAHDGGLEFTKADRSVVVQNFVAVRVRRAGAVLLAQVPDLRGGCAQLRAGLAHFALEHPTKARHLRRVARHLPGSRRLLEAVRDHCQGGRVIVMARLTNLAKQVSYNGALLSADLKLSAQAARLINKIAGEQAVSAGAPLGTAESRVTVVD